MGKTALASNIAFNIAKSFGDQINENDINQSNDKKKTLVLLHFFH